VRGLILAGGLGKRLRPLTHTGPKQLIPIANKPVLHYCIEDLVNAGIKDIGVIVGYTEDRINTIKESVGDGSKWGAKITYLEQDAPRGLAHAVWIAKDFLKNDDFVVYLGDNILKGGIKHFVEEFKKSDAEASILLCKVDKPEKFGIATLDNKGNIIEVEEKPQKPKTNYAIVGVYLFKSIIFEHIKNLKPSTRNELELTHVIQALIESKHKIISHFVNGWWDDAGTTDDILHANYIMLNDIQSSEIKGKVEEKAKIIGNIKLGEGSIVRSGSLIKGPVIIGKNCDIGENVYIGPYTSIGDNTKIINGEIESSIIIGDSVIDCKGKIVDSLVGKQSNIISSNKLPKGYKIITGENSEISL
jgi:glucose-1-phosphate thymidylyltransferase